ncbi:MAG: restriction endonuclease subunit S [Ktedonobacteraceae bacterium]|nr:restriction endonuclease subunit S [Ktedonobacteraceae bacterium]
MIEQELLPILERSIQIGKWKAYEGYKDSGIEWVGKVPAHWEVRKLKYLTYLKYGNSLPADKREDGAILVFGSNGSVGTHSQANTSSPVIIIGRKGSSGKIVFSEFPCYAIDTTYYVDKTAKEICMRWLFYVLRLLRLDEFSEDTAVPGLNRDYVHMQQLPLATINEQQAIATFLDRETARLNELITKKERMIALLQERRTAIINRAITRGLKPDVPMRDSGVEWLGEIPAHWEVRRVKHLTTFITSGSRGWAQYYSDYGAIFLRIGNLSRDTIRLDLEDTQRVLPPKGTEGQRTKVNQNDILISITAYIGSIAVITEDIGEAYVSQHIALTRPCLNIVNPIWLGYFLLSAPGQDQFRLSQYGGTKDGLGLYDIKNLDIIIPPLPEQRALVTYIEKETAKIDKLISVIEEGIKKLKEYSTALISAAVTGKIDVRGEVAAMPTIEPAAL